jgi:hypothetical protein
MILLHGTTRDRAERIRDHEPDPHFCEPGGTAGNEGFSMTLETGPYLFGTPEQYAVGKAQRFPGEGGPAILVVDVPDQIFQKAVNAWFPLSQGLVQFDPGAGLEEQAAAWPTLPKQIRGVS